MKHHTTAAAINHALVIAGITAAELAQRLDVTPQYISGLTTGRRGASVERLEEIGEALGLELVVRFEKNTETPHGRVFDERQGDE